METSALRVVNSRTKTPAWPGARMVRLEELNPIAGSDRALSIKLPSARGPIFRRRAGVDLRLALTVPRGTIRAMLDFSGRGIRNIGSWGFTAR